MATFVQYKGDIGGGHTPVGSLTPTFDSATTTGNLIVVAVLVTHATDPPEAAATDNYGNAYSAVATYRMNEPVGWRLTLLRAEVIAGGADHQVTIVPAGGGTYPMVGAIHEYEPTASGLRLDVASAATDEDTDTAEPDVESTLATTGLMFAMFATTGTASAAAAGSDFAKRYEQIGDIGPRLVTIDRVAAPGGLETASVAFSDLEAGARIGMIAAGFRDAAADLSRIGPGLVRRANEMGTIGDFAPGATVRFRFNTHDASKLAATLTGGTLAVLRDDSTSESTAGLTLTVDFDGRTGLHLVEVDTSADGTFYAAGSDFDVILAAGTVDGASVADANVGSFSIANRGPTRANVTQVDGVDLTAHTAGMIPAQMLDMDELLVGDPEELADAVLTRDVTTVEASAPVLSLVTAVLGTIEWEIVPGTPPTYRIRKSTGAAHAERDLDTAAISGAEVVTGTQGPE